MTGLCESVDRCGGELARSAGEFGDGECVNSLVDRKESLQSPQNKRKRKLGQPGESELITEQVSSQVVLEERKNESKQN